MIAVEAVWVVGLVIKPGESPGLTIKSIEAVVLGSDPNVAISVLEDRINRIAT